VVDRRTVAWPRLVVVLVGNRYRIGGGQVPGLSGVGSRSRVRGAFLVDPWWIAILMSHKRA
jgi:hypothetical protein